MKGHWQQRFRNELSQRANHLSYHTISFLSPGDNDELESSAFFGFRSAILYFQLSPYLQVDKVFLNTILQILKLFIYPRYPGAKRFITLFFNNSQSRLLFPEPLIMKYTEVDEQVEKYLKLYASSLVDYSRNFCNLFPDIDPIRYCFKDRIPSPEDICLVFHDRSGFEINKEILPEILRLKRRFIWICLDRESFFIEYDRIPELKKQPEQEARPTTDQPIKPKMKGNKKEDGNLYKAIPPDLYLYLNYEISPLKFEKIEIKFPSIMTLKQTDKERTVKERSSRISYEEMKALWALIRDNDIFRRKSRHQPKTRTGRSWEIEIRAEGKRKVCRGTGEIPGNLSEIFSMIKLTAKKA